jgi:CheY-like chemotaxis protein
MNPTLLLVDDEPSIIDAIESSLFDEHYTIYKASCAAEALSVLEQHPITVIITDQVMPGMSGVDLCATVHQRWPTTYRILLSSQTDTVIEPATLKGDIHQHLPKPWDAMLLRYNIHEGIRQQKLLQQGLNLSTSFQQQDQACIITDSNWVIQIASTSSASWLGLDVEKLIGKNLFSREISNNSIEDETQLITMLNSKNHWQGCFHLNTNSIHGNEAWMCIVPFAEQHYLCLAVPMIDDMLSQLTGEVKLTSSNQDAFQRDESSFNYLKIIIKHPSKQSLDFITVINERLQLASDNLYKIFSTLEGDHIIQIPAKHSDKYIDNLLAAIHQGFNEVIAFHGQEQQVQWHCEKVDNPTENFSPARESITQAISAQGKQPTAVAVEKATSKESYQGHSYFQPHQYDKSGFTCLPIFDQQGQAIALMPPCCESKEQVEQWLFDATECSQEWQKYTEKNINWVNDLSHLKPHQVLKALGAIAALSNKDGQANNSWTLILTSEQLGEIKQLHETLKQQLEYLAIKLLVKNPDYHLNSIKEFEHSLPSLFAGLCVDQNWLFNQQQAKRHSVTLLNHLRSHKLLILAVGIGSPEQLALLHTSPCHWLAGDILSVKLLPQQISWLHQ